MGTPMTVVGRVCDFFKGIKSLLETENVSSSLILQGNRVRDLIASQDGTQSSEIWMSALGFIRDTCQYTVSTISESREDVRRNKDLKSLVEAYFESTAESLALFNTVEKCVMETQSNNLILEFAVKLFETESVDKYAKTLEELNRFKAIGNPFSEECGTKFESVCERHHMLLEETSKQQEKYKHGGLLKKLLNAFYLYGVFIASAIAVKLHGEQGKQVCEIVAKEQEQETMSSIEDVAKTIDLQVENLKALISSMLITSVEFDVERQEVEDAIKLAIQQIKRDMEAFSEKFEEVRKSAAECSKSINSGRLSVLTHMTDSVAQV